MRGLTRRWVPRGGPGQEAPTDGPLLERVLRARGLADPECARRFCDPKLTDLHEPALLPNLEAAAQRLAAAVRGGESIVLYGDYDVDGIAACAVLYHVIRAVAPEAKIATYVPHRLEEGYGLNAEALRRLRAGGADLAVSVDCGVTAFEAAAAARAAGLDLIITDHHHLPDPADGLPPAAAVVHPRLEGSEYPFGDLCGAGVAWKLAWGFATTWCGSRRVGRAVKETLLHMLPLAALGTIADVVPLVDENRTIAAFGLRWLKQTPITGLRALIEASDLAGEEIDSEKVGFILAPRLNACGRMGHAAEAVRLLTDAGAAEAGEIAQRLVGLNRQRQQTERRITEEAASRAREAGLTGEDRRAIVLADESWHPGVIGIVCSRLVERYGRPVVLLQRRGGVCRGSPRSIEGYSIHDALSAAGRHLISFGGHDAAAGLSLRSADLDAFSEALIEHANARIPAEALTPRIEFDCDARLGELELETVGRLRALSPFGRANPRPALRVGGTVAGPPRRVGANGRHLNLSLRSQEQGRRRWLRTVWFGGGDRAADLAAGMRVEAVVEPKVNAFNGRVTVEGVLQDVRLAGPRRP